MSDKDLDRSIALCALTQAANLVDRLATHGQIPPSNYELMRHSLFQFEVDSAQEIYQGPQDNPSAEAQSPTQSLNVGLRVCEDMLDGADKEYPHTLRYILSLVQLEQHFNRSGKMKAKVRLRLQELEEQNLNSDELDEAISNLYLNSLAKLPFRIQVLGKMQHLQNTENEHRVRVLLFSGLRAAMLWRQSGGRRWHFLFNKGGIRRGLENLRQH